MSGFGEQPELDLGLESPDVDEEGIPADSLANPFLAKIPEADRAIVGKYVKDWDAGVTRKFQDIHSEYKPYKDLGVGVEDIQGAMALVEMLNEDPQRVYQLLGQALNDQGGQEQQQQFGQQQQQAGVDSEYGELPPQFVDKFSRMEQTLEALAGRFLQDAETRQSEQEDRALDDYMAELHKHYGNFDDEWVLAKMLNGMDGEEAVKHYEKWLQSQLSSRMSAKRPVPVLGGGGGVPHQGADTTKMSGTDIRQLVAGMLENAAGQ